MTTTARKFYFFAFTGAHRREHYRRRGILFTTAFRPIELGTADNLDANPPVVGPETFAVLMEEAKVHPHAEDKLGSKTSPMTMLMAREATTEEVRDYLEKQKELKPRDRVEDLEQENAELKASRREIEERLMKLEIASGQPEADKRKASKS